MAGIENLKTGELARKIAFPALLTIGVVSVASLSFWFVSLNSQSELQAALEHCELSSSQHVELVDNGSRLYLNGQGQEEPGLEAQDFKCLFKGLELPKILVDRIIHTNALMGSQNATTAKYDLQWTAQPAIGLDMTIEIKR